MELLSARDIYSRPHLRTKSIRILTGERGILMGALAGVMEAQYNELRKHGHTPSEAFNETVEELTQSLIRLVGQNGMDWMYANCSTTAQRGALDWKNKFRDAVAPVFKDLYQSVVAGEETRIVLDKEQRSEISRKSGCRTESHAQIPKCGGLARLSALCARKLEEVKRRLYE